MPDAKAGVSVRSELPSLTISAISVASVCTTSRTDSVYVPVTPKLAAST